MFRTFRHHSRRPGRAVDLRVRLGLEALGERSLPSVTVMPTPSTDHGDTTLVVKTTGADDRVTVTDNSLDHTTTVVANGKTMTFSHQFAHFDLELMSREDELTFNAVGDYSARRADLRVNLGRGENHFTFNPGLTAITKHSDVRLNILGHNGHDFLNVGFGNILESRVNVSANNLGGSRTPADPASANDIITFGTRRAGIRNSSVDVNIGLGRGNNNVRFNYGSDLGHLAGPAGTADQPGDFGPSTFNVNLNGSNRRQDVDNIELFANGEVNTGSTLNFNTRLGEGNNSFKAKFDANDFQIDDDGGVFSPGPTPGTFAPHSGGVAHFNVQAGGGRDNISFQSINQDHTIELSGLFDVNVLGGSGRDKVNVDFGGAGFTDDDPFELAATNRAFRLRVDGGTGSDKMNVNLANAATATFDWDVALLGGAAGRNDITFAGNNAKGGMPTFGPSGTVSIDGGPGDGNVVHTSGNFPVDVVNAQMKKGV